MEIKRLFRSLDADTLSPVGNDPRHIGKYFVICPPQEQADLLQSLRTYSQWYNLKLLHTDNQQYRELGPIPLPEERQCILLIDHLFRPDGTVDVGLLSDIINSYAIRYRRLTSILLLLNNWDERLKFVEYPSIYDYYQVRDLAEE